MTPKRSFLDRVLPQSVGGQLLAMLLLALAITQGLGLILLTDERNRAVRAALGLEAAGRAANPDGLVMPASSPGRRTSTVVGVWAALW